jgi:hypothetical protein
MAGSRVRPRAPRTATRRFARHRADHGKRNGVGRVSPVLATADRGTSLTRRRFPVISLRLRTRPIGPVGQKIA